MERITLYPLFFVRFSHTLTHTMHAGVVSAGESSTRDEEGGDSDEEEKTEAKFIQPIIEFIKQFRRLCLPCIQQQDQAGGNDASSCGR